MCLQLPLVLLPKIKCSNCCLIKELCQIPIHIHIMSEIIDSLHFALQQIKILIEPPPNEEGKLVQRSSNAKHPYYRRPGRGHNHDLCDACEEGGNLLCCDRCPSSFHLQCQ